MLLTDLLFIFLALSGLFFWFCMAVYWVSKNDKKDDENRS